MDQVDETKGCGKLRAIISCLFALSAMLEPMLPSAEKLVLTIEVVKQAIKKALSDERFITLKFPFDLHTIIVTLI